MENLPVKIDCFKLNNYKGDLNDAVKEHIGYILIPVKNIPTHPLVKAYQVKPRWHKFIGVNREFRQYHPELLLNIMITEKSFLTANKTIMHESYNLESGDSITFEENPNPCMLTSQKGIFIRLLQEEGLLQVGNIDTECDIFVVKILIKHVKFLDSITAENDEDKLNKDFHINYLLLGNSYHRTIEKKFNRTLLISEKISINFRSSLKSLKDYFDQVFYIPIEIYQSSHKVGVTEIRLKNHIPTTDLNEFIEKYPKHFEMEGTANIKLPANAKDNKPIIEYKFLVHYEATKKLHQAELLETYKKQVYDPRGGGDYLPLVPEKPKTVQNVDEGQFKVVGIGKSSNGSKKEIQKSPEKTDIESLLNTQEGGKISELPRLFTYNLKLKSVKFNRKPQRGIWQISFYHEKADTQRTFINIDITNDHCVDDENSINFNDLELKLYFTSTSLDIMNLIKSSSICTLCIKGPHNTHVKAQLDCKSLLISNKEKTCGNILLTNQHESVSALAQIFVYLDDHGLNFNARISHPEAQFFNNENEPHVSNLNVTKTLNDQKVHLFDEDIAYKMIEELNEWKEQEQNKFLSELKKTEENYLEKLSIAWHEKKKKHEEEFEDKTKKLASLSKSLQEVQKSFQERDDLRMKSEEEIISYKLDLERAFKDQLLVFKERAKQLQDDLMYEIKVKEIKIDELEQTNKILTEENCELKKAIDEMRKKSINKISVSKEEYDRVLREMSILRNDLEKAIESKQQYKDQWTKAFRENSQLRRSQISEARDYNFNNRIDR